MSTIKILYLSRFLFSIGLIITLIPWLATVDHIFDPTYLLIPQFKLGIHHAQYHAFRQSFEEFFIMVVLILFFWGPQRWRNQITWGISLLLIVGFYLPFFIGEPFLHYLSAPGNVPGLKYSVNLPSIIHAIITILMFAAIILSYFHLTKK